mmetsp:Transcript_8319/g.31333  ORF Transcript_8319/g.31333 Transcript_8319/m.31333 type:complete len:271 (-) Transcript_8319:863-1675(-)|eukprot:scaffold3854_cov251-Pinguiococcus_pyrenoidosus.AAC.15
MPLGLPVHIGDGKIRCRALGRSDGCRSLAMPLLLLRRVDAPAESHLHPVRPDVGRDRRDDAVNAARVPHARTEAIRDGHDRVPLLYSGDVSGAAFLHLAHDNRAAELLLDEGHAQRLPHDHVPHFLPLLADAQILLSQGALEAHSDGGSDSEAGSHCAEHPRLCALLPHVAAHGRGRRYYTIIHAHSTRLAAAAGDHGAYVHPRLLVLSIPACSLLEGEAQRSSQLDLVGVRALHEIFGNELGSGRPARRIHGAAFAGVPRAPPGVLVSR